jgi:hypothetical protein
VTTEAGAAPTRERVDQRVTTWLADPRHAGAAIAGAFAVGLLGGWLVLGWWLAPRPVSNATPAQLAPALRTLYVQTAADAFVRESNDLSRAGLRLNSFSREQLEAVFTELLADPSVSPVSRSNVTELAAKLAIAPALATAVPATTAPPSSGGTASSGWARWLALLVGALALLGAGAWLVRRALRSGSGTAGGPATLPADEDFGHARAATRGRGSAPAWRPGRLYLDDTITTRYRAGDEPFYQSYLVHDERGVLVGSVSMQSQLIGSVNTVDIWLVERDNDAAEGETPLVTFAAQAAVADGIFRARLSDRQLMPATPGAHAQLESPHILLDIRVRAVEPDPDLAALQLSDLTLSLTPTRPSPATAREAAAVGELEPPIPLPFRTD